MDRAALPDRFRSLHTLINSTFNLARLREGLKPFRLHWFARVGSTSTHASKMRREGRLFAPAVVLAGRQLAGRGRGTNQWWSAGGSLTVTFALPTEERVEPHQLPLIAGLAVRRAAAALTGDDGVQLKWPNDLLYDRRKLSGLLCERVEKADLIGLGLNVNLDPADAPPHLRNRITSLKTIAGRHFDMTDVLIAIARELRLMLKESTNRPFADVLREYDSHHALLGQTVTVVAGDSEPLTGRVEGMDEMGRLLLRSGGKLHHIIAGQVNGGY